LTVLAQLESGRRERVAARSHLEEALALTELQTGRTSQQTADALHSLAVVLIDSSELGKAEELLLRQVAIREQRAGVRDKPLADALYRLSFLYRAQRSFEKARTYGERALQMRRDVLDPYSADIATSLTSLANLARMEGNSPRARPLLEEALAIRLVTLGPGHGDVALTQSVLGQTALDLGDYETAATLMRRAESTYVEAGEPGDVGLSRCRVGLASLFHTIGEYDSVRAVVSRMTAVLDASLAGELSVMEAQTLQLASNLVRATGDHLRARTFAERLVKLHTKQPGADSLVLADALHGLANTLAELRDVHSAIPLYEHVLRIQERKFGPTSSRLWAVLNDYAATLGDAKDFEKTTVVLQRVVDILEHESPEEAAGLSQVMGNLAAALRHLNRLSEADSCYRRATALCEGSPSESCLESASRRLRGEAYLRIREGRLDEAMRLADRALQESEQGGGRRSVATIDSRALVSALLLRAGQPAAAFEASVAAMLDANAMVRETILGLSEAEALNYATLQAQTAGVALSVAASGRAPAGGVRLVWDAIMRSRASILDELARRNRAVSIAGDARTDSLARALSSARRRVANLILWPAQTTPPGRADAMIDSLRRDGERLERELAGSDVVARQTLDAERAGFDRVSQSLCDSCAILALVEASPDSSSMFPDTPHESVVYALVATEERPEPTITRLGTSSEMDALVSEWRSAVSSREAHSDERAGRIAGAALRRWLWDPVAPGLSGSRTVLVVPDGAASFVNLAALPESETSYLLETGPLFHYLSAERDIVDPRSEGGERKELLAVGAVDFDLNGHSGPMTTSTGARGAHDVASSPRHRRATSTCMSLDSMLFGKLPASGVELERVARAWRAQPEVAGADVVTLLGQQASEVNLKQRASRARAIHLATHGFYLGNSCGASARASMNTTFEPGDALREESPLIRSGIALAGANARDLGDESADDGILTASEIASLDLRGVDWVALSACQTGVGDVVSGEGVFGLRRAFHVAGAGTLVMSLWDVEDKSAARFMEALYRERFGRGRSVPEAMREAARSVIAWRRGRRASAGPATWGAFVATGSWK